MSQSGFALLPQTFSSADLEVNKYFNYFLMNEVDYLFLINYIVKYLFIAPLML